MHTHIQWRKIYQIILSKKKNQIIILNNYYESPISFFLPLHICMAREALPFLLMVSVLMKMRVHDGSHSSIQDNNHQVWKKLWKIKSIPRHNHFFLEDST